MTPSLAAYWWKILNLAVFDGALRQPEKFVIKEKLFDKSAIWGRLEVSRSYSKNANFTYYFVEAMNNRALFLAILAHEMVHQDEQQKHGRMTHGRNFWAWKPKIDQLGLEFGVSYY